MTWQDNVVTNAPCRSAAEDDTAGTPLPWMLGTRWGTATTQANCPV
ncbi:hypothetical protein [Streptomyces sp. NPDC056188]